MTAILHNRLYFTDLELEEALHQSESPVAHNNPKFWLHIA